MCTLSVAQMKSQFRLGPPKVTFATALGSRILPSSAADEL
jgi:hypothetical protein